MAILVDNLKEDQAERDQPDPEHVHVPFGRGRREHFGTALYTSDVADLRDAGAGALHLLSGDAARRWRAWNVWILRGTTRVARGARGLMGYPRLMVFSAADLRGN